ncbi:purine and uridine phosphorylase [Aspergillus tetrazonus]
MTTRSRVPLEAAAARAMLDKIHNPPHQITDPNAYEFGELNGHHIVIAYLPNGVYGTVSAATVVSRMCLTFPRLQFGLMVGIGGGVPSKGNDIRLGDVVVSKPGGKHGGVMQYDYGKAVQGGQFVPTGILNQPPQVLLTHLSQLEAKQIIGEDTISKIVDAVLEQNPSIKDRFSPLDQHMDYLFNSSYHHVNKNSDCEECDKTQLVKRQPRDRRTSCIHYGLIASGDRVMEDSETRDRLAQQHEILCFEMEAAGLMNVLPTLVIRGICDYCDSHKQKQWQGYAALTAAAYTKLLLSAIPVLQTIPGSPKESREQHWVVSLPRNPKFVGRQDEITKLEELITMQDGPRRIAITGLGGVGKTQIALEVAYRIRDQDQECTVLWVPCTSHALIEQMFFRFAEILGIHGVKPADAKEQIKTYLSSKRAGKWLLVFDNADDTEMWLAANGTAPALEDLLPQSEQGHVLFTTRNRKLAMKLAPFSIIQIPDVDRETALEIFAKALEHENLPEDTTTATALLEQLAFLPLAITQASAYIIENKISLSDYLALLQEQEEDAVELLSEDFRDPGRYMDVQNAVITTWLISFSQIQHQSQASADYLSFMACINPRNIPRSLLPSQSTKKQTVDALGQDTDISMHRLKNELFSHWIQKVADQIQKVFPNDHYTNRKLWQKYLPHALAEQHTNLIRKVADSEALYRQLLELDQGRKGPEHPDTLTGMANLASTYWNQGRWNEAEKLQVEFHGSESEWLQYFSPILHLTRMSFGYGTTWMSTK